MQDNFNIHEWRINQTIQETEKIKGKDGKGCWKGYRYAGTENGKDKCVPVNEDKNLTVDLPDADSQTIAYKISDALLKAGYNRDMIKLVAKAILTRPSLQEGKQLCKECGEGYMEEGQCMECGYMEEGATFTGKHDDNPKLKGGQKDLPDEVQAKIVAKEGHSSLSHVEQIESILDNLVRNISTDSTISTTSKIGLLRAFKELKNYIEELGAEIEQNEEN